MQLHIVAADGTGSPEAFWAMPLSYTANIERKTSQKEIAAGGTVNCAEPARETDRVMKGAGPIYPDENAGVLAVRDSAKTLWVFGDGDAAWECRIFAWDVMALGNGVYSLEFDLRPVRRLTPGGAG